MFHFPNFLGAFCHLVLSIGEPLCFFGDEAENGEKKWWYSNILSFLLIKRCDERISSSEEEDQILQGDLNSMWNSFLCLHLLSPSSYQGLGSLKLKQKKNCMRIYNWFISWFLFKISGWYLFGNYMIRIYNFSESFTGKSMLLISLLWQSLFSTKWTNKNRIYGPFQDWMEAQLRRFPRNKTPVWSIFTLGLIIAFIYYCEFIFPVM